MKGNGGFSTPNLPSKPLSTLPFFLPKHGFKESDPLKHLQTLPPKQGLRALATTKGSSKGNSCQVELAVGSCFECVSSLVNMSSPLVEQSRLLLGAN